MKKGTTNLLLVFASLFILVSISEFVLQKFYPIIILDTIFEKDDLLPYSLRKNSVGGLKTKEFNFHVSINSLGYRDEEFNLNQRKKRILVIGDSFTFGYGVNNDESYPALLNNLLKKNEIVVINAGFQGCYSLDTYYLYLKERGLKLNPDIIVIGLFIGNDIEHPLSDENIWTKVDSNGFPIRIINKYSTHNFYKDFFFNYSFFRSSNLVKLIFHTSDNIVRKILVGDKEEEWINNSNDFINIYRDKYLMKTEKRFDDAEKMILAISDVAKQNNSEIIFLLIPELLQIDSSKIPRIIINNEKLDREKPQQILREFFIENNLNYIDLLHELIQYNAEDLYYSDDRHWNKQGHEVASKVIYNYIVENNFQLDSEYEK